MRFLPRRNRGGRRAVADIEQAIENVLSESELVDAPGRLLAAEEAAGALVRTNNVLDDLAARRRIAKARRRFLQATAAALVARSALEEYRWQEYRQAVYQDTVISAAQRRRQDVAAAFQSTPFLDRSRAGIAATAGPDHDPEWSAPPAPPSFLDRVRIRRAAQAARGPRPSRHWNPAHIKPSVLLKAELVLAAGEVALWLAAFSADIFGRKTLPQMKAAYVVLAVFIPIAGLTIARVTGVVGRGWRAPAWFGSVLGLAALYCVGYSTFQLLRGRFTPSNGSVKHASTGLQSGPLAVLVIALICADALARIYAVPYPTSGMGPKGAREANLVTAAVAQRDAAAALQAEVDTVLDRTSGNQAAGDLVTQRARAGGSSGAASAAAAALAAGLSKVAAARATLSASVAHHASSAEALLRTTPVVEFPTIEPAPTHPGAAGATAAPPADQRAPEPDADKDRDKATSPNESTLPLNTDPDEPPETGSDPGPEVEPPTIFPESP